MSPEDLWVRYGICCGFSLVLALRVASAPTISGLWRSSVGRLKNLVSQRGMLPTPGCFNNTVPPAPRRGGTGEGSQGLSGLEKKTSFRFALLHLQLHS